MNIKGQITVVKEIESITTKDKRIILKRTAVVETDGGEIRPVDCIRCDGRRCQ